ncbi:hypothetical protein PSECIP111854_00473 [Pseudoalteromonas sp. CIP111854]|uniref:Cytochrome b561 bacterial/Ni-hydrogenase domain-containing protein n=1 Tax=Pseudoalteromonas holothuriae TaxID=2963714 RepID=A0A9W4VRE8_9GAMM|nr:cytochrome b/b6 domain-containing protein [Pseudoalteromonas sp. CIP111854]CAH9050163.1 hypothetical protein PSECIP111854_00473 [Pseudoalteromonas sp. CIP111854]
MKSKSYIIDRALHWGVALLLLFMLMNLSSQLHNTDWAIKGQDLHRQEAIQTHATMGILLVLLIAARLAFLFTTKATLSRAKPKNKFHEWVIRIVHATMYLSVFMLMGTGIAMINNYEIPLVIFGMEFTPDKANFYGIFPEFHDYHMLLKQVILWLIFVHFFGALLTKK